MYTQHVHEEKTLSFRNWRSVSKKISRGRVRARAVPGKNGLFLIAEEEVGGYPDKLAAGCFFSQTQSWMERRVGYINFLKTPEGRTRLSVCSAAAAGVHGTSRGGGEEDHVERRDQVLRTGREPLVSLPGSPRILDIHARFLRRTWRFFLSVRRRGKRRTAN